MSSPANKHEDSSWLFTTLGSLELDFRKYELVVFDHDEIWFLKHRHAKVTLCRLLASKGSSVVTRCVSTPQCSTLNQLAGILYPHGWTGTGTRTELRLMSPASASLLCLFQSIFKNTKLVTSKIEKVLVTYSTLLHTTPLSWKYANASHEGWSSRTAPLMEDWKSASECHFDRSFQ